MMKEKSDELKQNLELCQSLYEDVTKDLTKLYKIINKRVDLTTEKKLK